jgi:hypothetical protein
VSVNVSFLVTLSPTLLVKQFVEHSSSVRCERATSSSSLSSKTSTNDRLHLFRSVHRAFETIVVVLMREQPTGMITFVKTNEYVDHSTRFDCISTVCHIVNEDSLSLSIDNPVEEESRRECQICLEEWLIDEAYIKRCPPDVVRSKKSRRIVLVNVDGSERSFFEFNVTNIDWSDVSFVMLRGTGRSSESEPRRSIKISTMHKSVRIVKCIHGNALLAMTLNSSERPFYRLTFSLKSARKMSSVVQRPLLSKENVESTKCLYIY